MTEEKLLTANEVSMIVGCTVPTLTTWYKWKELHPDDQKAKILPDYIREGNQERGRRLWKYNDLFRIIQFKNTVKNGVKGFMGDVTHRYDKKENTNDSKNS